LKPEALHPFETKNQERMNQQTMRFAIPLSLLSGVLLTVGFPKLDLFYLSWGALIPLFVALRGKSGKEAFGLGYVCGLAHFVTTLYWIHYVINHYGALPSPVAILALLLLCAYLALFPACFAYVAHKWEEHPLLWGLGLPAVWVALEWVRGHALTGFPWATLGYSQTPFTPLIQIADITGVLGVSWLVVLGSTAITACFNRRRPRIVFPVFAACMLAAILYGSWRLDVVKRLQEQAPPWTVGVFQGNVDQSQKWDPAFQQEAIERYRNLSLQASRSDPAPDLLVWPETAVPFFYGIEDQLTAQLNRIFQEVGKPVLFGSPAVGLVDGQGRLMNRAYLVNTGGEILGAYAKQHLVPFGEYVPLQKILFFVHRLVQAAGDFVPGRSSVPLALDGRRPGVLICYEGIFPELARSTVMQGATSLINITNDAWYGDTSAPYQHLEIARWRAIELRVPLIRAANTGISAIFDASGGCLGTISLNEQGYLIRTVHPFPIHTFYARWGDLFAWMCILIAVGGILYSGKLRQAVVGMKKRNASRRLKHSGS